MVAILLHRLLQIRKVIIYLPFNNVRVWGFIGISLRWLKILKSVRVGDHRRCDSENVKRNRNGFVGIVRLYLSKEFRRWESY